ncbi:MAG: MFS transporter, partial [Anaerolineae bacterium]|nr:MFS transporter [Anaerolineae bacterium]
LVSILGTAIGFIIFGVAEPLAGGIGSVFGQDQVTGVGVLAILCGARITDGLTGGNISVAQAYISDITDTASRPRALGLIGVAFGLGFIIGPAAGAFLSRDGNYALPSLIAAAIAGLNLVLVYFLLPESLSAEQREMAMKGHAGKRAISFETLLEALRRPLVGPVLIVTFVFGIAFAMFQTVFSLYALRRFDLSSEQTGYVLAYVGLLSVLVQGVLVGPVTRRFEDVRVIIVAIGVMAVSLLAWALVPSIPLLLLVLIPTSASGGLMNVLLRSSITRAVARDEFGGILGAQASVESMTRVAAPTIGGLLINFFGAAAPGVFGFVVLLVLLPLASSRLIRDSRLVAEAARQSVAAQANATLAEPAGD